MPAEPPPAPRAFIPPAPERTINRPRRMPGIDELPRPAQAELRAKRGEDDPDHPEKRKVSLLRRLAAVGLGRRDDQEEPEKTPTHFPAGSPRPGPAGRAPGRSGGATPEHAGDAARPRAGVGIRQASGCSKGSIPSAGRRLCITRWRRINSTSRPSCAGRRTDHAGARRRYGPGAGRRDRPPGPSNGLNHNTNCVSCRTPAPPWRTPLRPHPLAAAAPPAPSLGNRRSSRLRPRDGNSR